MRSLLFAIATSAYAITLLPGCPLACGAAYDGAGDQVFRRGDDSLIACANGGYAAMVGGASLEGRITRTDGGDLRGTHGESGAQAFTLRNLFTADGQWSSPELGEGWQQVTLDETDLDHADLLCTDVASRAWFSTAQTLPQPTAFASGEDTLMFCPDGHVQIASGDRRFDGTYTADAGQLKVFPTAVQPFEGAYTPGTFTGGNPHGAANVVWTEVAPQTLAGMSCR